MCPRKTGPVETDTREVGLAKVRHGQPGFGEISAHEFCLAKLGCAKDAARCAGVAEICLREISAQALRSGKRRLNQDCPPEVRAIQSGLSLVGLPKVASRQICAPQISLMKVQPAQIESR